MSELSKVLMELHESGDVGRAVEGYSERAKALEEEITQLRQQLAAVKTQLNAGEAVAEIIPNTYGTELSWNSSVMKNGLPVGAKLYLHPAPVVPELDVTDLEVTAWPEQQGGMHVGMAKGVKIKQKSTGIEVCCDTEQSQHRNRDKCFAMLKAAHGNSAPVVPEGLLNEVFAKGWTTAAIWAKRDDLIADIDSPGYICDRHVMLSAAQEQG